MSARVEMLGQPLSGLIVEVIHGAVVAEGMISRPRSYGINQQFLDHGVADQRVSNGTSDRSPGRSGVVCDDVGILDKPSRAEGNQLRVAGTDADPVEVSSHAISDSRARALIAAAHKADPPRRPCTTSHGRSHGFSANAIFDSVEPTKPTGIPIIAAGRGPPSAISSNR